MLNVLVSKYIYTYTIVNYKPKHQQSADSILFILFTCVFYLYKQHNNITKPIIKPFALDECIKHQMNENYFSHQEISLFSYWHNYMKKKLGSFFVCK